MTRFRLLALVVVVAVTACSPMASLEPQIVGDPLPGYVRVVMDPPNAIAPVTIRFHAVGLGGPSTVYFPFEAGDRILIVFPSTPGDLALQVSDVVCAGQWSTQSNVETDVLLHVDDGSCRTEAVGSHPVGTVHTDPVTEPRIDGSSPTVLPTQAALSTLSQRCIREG